MKHPHVIPTPHSRGIQERIGGLSWLKSHVGKRTTLDICFFVVLFWFCIWYFWQTTITNGLFTDVRAMQQANIALQSSREEQITQIFCLDWKSTYEFHGKRFGSRVLGLGFRINYLLVPSTSEVNLATDLKSSTAETQGFTPSTYYYICTLKKIPRDREWCTV